MTWPCRARAAADSSPATKMTPSNPAISQSAARKPAISSSRPPTKKPMPFIAFFEPVNQATHRNSCPLPSARRRLDRGFRRRLGQVLGDAGDALRDDHPGDRRGRAPAGIERRQHQQAGDLQHLADRQHARNAEARREPAAAEVGDDAGELVEQEQERQRERRVAELEEMEQHQHPQRAVDQREAPVGCGDDEVVAHRRGHHAPLR